jgi:DNA-binding response OmpR family regulator
LIVDDNHDLRENLAEILVEEGYVVRLAPTADAAAAWMEGAERPPDAVLLDLYIPGMTPRRFVSLLRERPRFAQSKVILVTAAEERDIPRDAPLDAVLLKPFRIDQLLAVLKSLDVNPDRPA